jgi:5'-deoxynucleotidase YfbR-like HD superfamily hydrolase
LLHDAGEAYFADIPNPIKREYEVFEEIENPIMAAVMEKFNLSPLEDGLSMPKEVKHADRVALATEARDLLPVIWRGWEQMWGPLALTERVVPVDPTTAKMMFLEEYHRIID